MMAPYYTSSHLWIPTLGGSVAAVYLLPIITILDTVVGWTLRATIDIVSKDSGYYTMSHVIFCPLFYACSRPDILLEHS